MAVRLIVVAAGEEDSWLEVEEEQTPRVAAVLVDHQRQEEAGLLLSLPSEEEVVDRAERHHLEVGVLEIVVAVPSCAS